jgi:nucleotide-binding universal stress UspA family protein
LQAGRIKAVAFLVAPGKPSGGGRTFASLTQVGSAMTERLHDDRGKGRPLSRRPDAGNSSSSRHVRTNFDFSQIAGGHSVTLVGQLDRFALGKDAMTYSTLMVYLELEHSNDARLEIAGDLAERFDATLIGVVSCDPQLPYHPMGALAVEAFEHEQAEIKKRAKETEDRFRAAVWNRARTVEWRCGMEAPTEFVARQARAADLIIIGANREGVLLDPLRRLNPSDLVMQAGRPIFIVPPEAEHLRLNNVLVAWKDAREARRAVADALPLLHHAKNVDVLEVIAGEESQKAAQDRVNDVAAWLGRHNIPAAARVMHVVEQADQIDEIWSNAVDLIVAGAYGHTRFREWALGGFTNSILTRSRRCSLITH